MESRSILEGPQWQFIHYELLTLTINGAFQRARVYDKNASETGRESFRDEVRQQLTKYGDIYKSPQTPEQHLVHIEELASSLTRYAMQGANGLLLANNRFRIGIAQKALNLYLKYLWTIGRIPPPPHCPFDSIVINELCATDAACKDLAWTQMDSIDDYEKLVKIATRAAQHRQQSIAEWELEVSNR